MAYLECLAPAYRSPAERGCRLVVCNVTGVAEERGFRLFWADPDGRTMVPALGLVTSLPFRTERAAIAYGERHMGERATRARY